MTVAEYAAFEGLLGARPVAVNGLYWTRVRPFCYRPLLVFKPYSPGSITAPRLAFFGGFQHSVSAGETTNSTLNLLMFSNANGYSLDTLDYNRHRQVKKAAKEFSIRPIADLREFISEGYPAYLSFAERTGYSYGAQRRNRRCFANWAESIFKMSRVVVLGGYRNGALCGVSLSFLVEDTLVYATFFCDTVSMRLHLSDLMLHFMRENAASQGVRRIFAGLYKGGNGLDDFYLLRGCEKVSEPAWLRVNPCARLALARFLPKQYLQLQGRFEAKPWLSRQDPFPAANRESAVQRNATAVNEASR